ncbi:MAG: DUF2959 family protein [Desulfotignum sp.]|jgi:hypothetical protein|nr:DUF2959 family protein [Desulfotignum sp.]
MVKSQTLFSAWGIFLVLVVLSAGCSKTYYAAMEKLGKEKRHLLSDNVEDVKDSQTKAKEEFTDALTRIQELYAFDGGELETVYNRIKSSYDDCKSRADQIESRIAQAKSVAKDLFAEWAAEIQEIQDPGLKKTSRKSLFETRARFQNLETAMDRSARAMAPVLAKLRDTVLFLKHNLNARAVGALGKEAVSIETDVNALIRDMNAAIAEADQFIKHF